MAFAVLFVCTGNICRSPIAERFFASKAVGYSIGVASAGTHGLQGRPMDPACAEALSGWGISPDGHSARRLNEAMVREADLILAAETDQRAAAVRFAPGVFRQAFTVKEFARLGEGFTELNEVDIQSLRGRVVEVASRRGAVPAPREGSDDVQDPYGRGPDLAKKVTLELEIAVGRCVRALGLGEN